MGGNNSVPQIQESKLDNRISKLSQKYKQIICFSKTEIHLLKVSNYNFEIVKLATHEYGTVTAANLMENGKQIFAIAEKGNFIYELKSKLTSQVSNQGDGEKIKDIWNLICTKNKVWAFAQNDIYSYALEKQFFEFVRSHQPWKTITVSLKGDKFYIVCKEGIYSYSLVNSHTHIISNENFEQTWASFVFDDILHILTQNGLFRINTYNGLMQLVGVHPDKWPHYNKDKQYQYRYVNFDRDAYLFCSQYFIYLDLLSGGWFPLNQGDWSEFTAFTALK